MARSLLLQNLLIYSGSQLIVNQITEEYQAKDPKMEKYMSKAITLLVELTKYEIHQVSRSKNTNADALAKLASAYETDLARPVPVEILNEHSILEPDLMNIKVR